MEIMILILSGWTVGNTLYMRHVYQKCLASDLLLVDLIREQQST